MAPLLAVTGLSLLAGTVLSGGLIARLVVFGVGVAAVCAAAFVKRTRVSLERSRLSYRRFVGGWSIDLADVRSVDVPSNYRLLYVSIRTPDQARRLAPLSFDNADGLADALVGLLPGTACTPAALAVLEGIRAKASVDSINRAKWTAE